jgi:MFS family permease
LSGSQSGYIFGVSSIIDSVMFPIVGFVMDRWGRKYVGVPAYLILACGFAIIPLANTYTLLMLVGVLVGLGNGLSSGLVLTMGVDFAPRKNPGEFMGVWRLISDIGGASGPSAIGAYAAVVTLGTASVLTAGIGVLGAGILLFLVKETLVKDSDPLDKSPAKG